VRVLCREKRSPGQSFHGWRIRKTSPAGRRFRRATPISRDCLRPNPASRKRPGCPESEAGRGTYPQISPIFTDLDGFTRRILRICQKMPQGWLRKFPRRSKVALPELASASQPKRGSMIHGYASRRIRRISLVVSGFCGALWSEGTIFSLTAVFRCELQ